MTARTDATAPPLARRLVAEALGTALLLIGVVGSGIMGEALAGGNAGLALLANALATGCMLYVIITCLSPISGAHFNPAVTLAFALRGTIPWRDAIGYVAVQVPSGVVGVWLTHLIFAQPILQVSQTLHRTGVAQWVSEALATFGLLFAIFGGLKSRPEAVPTLVALYITGAYWFTASTSFANPAVTIARGFTDTFSGIYPGHVPAFVVAQVIGVLGTASLLTWLFTKD